MNRTAYLAVVLILLTSGCIETKDVLKILTGGGETTTLTPTTTIAPIELESTVNVLVKDMPSAIGEVDNATITIKKVEIEGEHSGPHTLFEGDGQQITLDEKRMYWIASNRVVNDTYTRLKITLGDKAALLINNTVVVADIEPKEITSTFRQRLEGNKTMNLIVDIPLKDTVRKKTLTNNESFRIVFRPRSFARAYTRITEGLNPETVGVADKNALGEGTVKVNLNVVGSSNLSMVGLTVNGRIIKLNLSGVRLHKLGGDWTAVCDEIETFSLEEGVYDYCPTAVVEAGSYDKLELGLAGIEVETTAAVISGFIRISLNKRSSMVEDYFDVESGTENNLTIILNVKDSLRKHTPSQQEFDPVLDIETTNQNCNGICETLCGRKLLPGCVQDCSFSINENCVKKSESECNVRCDAKLNINCQAKCQGEADALCQQKCASKPEELSCTAFCRIDYIPPCKDKCRSEMKDGCMADCRVDALKSCLYESRLIDCKLECKDKYDYANCMMTCRSKC